MLNEDIWRLQALRDVELPAFIGWLIEAKKTHLPASTKRLIDEYIEKLATDLESGRP